MVVAALLPILAGKISNAIYAKANEKLSRLDVKQKAADFLKRKLELSSVNTYVKDKSLANKKKLLEEKLKLSLISLKKLKDKGSKNIIFLEKLEAIDAIEEQISIIEDQQAKKQRQQIKVQEALDKRLSTLSPSKKDAVNLEAPEAKKLKSASSIFTSAPQKKSRNIKKTLGRPPGSKNKGKSGSDSSSLLDATRSSFGEIKNFKSDNLELESDSRLGISSQFKSKEGNKEIPLKGLKLTSMLLFNSIKQIDELEDINKNLGKLNKNINGVKGGSLLNSFKSSGPKNILKSALILAPKIIKAGGLIAAAFEVVSSVMDYGFTEKDLKKKLNEGEITQEQYDKSHKKNIYKNAGKSSGVVAGATAGGLLGSAILPGIGTGIGIMLGALAGGYFGKKAGLKLLEKSNLKTKEFSNASGRSQFTEGSWNKLIEKYNLNYTSEDRFDAKKSSHVASILAKKTKQTIERGIGQNASNTDLYMGTFLNARETIDFLNSKAENKYGIAANNPNLKNAVLASKSEFYNKEGLPKTYEEIYNSISVRANSFSRPISAEVMSKPEFISNKTQMTPIDHKIYSYDKGQAKIEKQQLEASSKSLADSISNFSSQGNQTIINNNSSNSNTKIPTDDYISSSIRYLINN